MENKLDKHTLSTEMIAAYLDGHATPAECRQVLNALQHDKQLRELLQVSLMVDAEMGVLNHQQDYLPMAALAADCGEDSYCCLECEKYIMRQHGLNYDELQLLHDATCNGWLKENGTALHNVGRHLEAAGLVVVRQYEASVQDIAKALSNGEGVIVAVDGGELLGSQHIEQLEDTYIGAMPDHTVVVTNYNEGKDEIIIFDPNSPNQQDSYNLSQFANAWADSKNYLVTIKKFTDMNTYEPKPIDVSDVILEEDVTELREAIAENAHEIWAIERMQEGWTYGPERNDELKHNPCMVPYSKLPESEKEYDRQMAMQTIKLMKKLGYDLVKHRDTDLYEQLLRRIRCSTQTFLCPACSKKGIKTPIYKHQAFCDVCGHELTDVNWNVYDEF